MASSPDHLFALLSRLLIAYTYDFDEALAREVGMQSPSLAMWANVLQFIPDEGLAASELPALSGIAKATLKSMINCLERHAWIAIDDGDMIRRTARGTKAQRAFAKANRDVERLWENRAGKATVAALRAALEDLSGQIDTRLPNYPMPAPHRGAFPTGE